MSMPKIEFLPLRPAIASQGGIDAAIQDAGGPEMRKASSALGGCLTLARDRGVKKLAFPALGCGD